MNGNNPYTVANRQAANFKLPPQDIDAERSVLGAIMLDKHAVVRVADILTPEDFYQSAHVKIFTIILELFGRGEPIDVRAARRSSCRSWCAERFSDRSRGMLDRHRG